MSKDTVYWVCFLLAAFWMLWHLGFDHNYFEPPHD